VSCQYLESNVKPLLTRLPETIQRATQRFCERNADFRHILTHLPFLERLSDTSREVALLVASTAGLQAPLPPGTREAFTGAVTRGKLQF
jgi:hypothetical protein